MMKHLIALLLTLIILSVCILSCLAEDEVEICKIGEKTQPLYEDESVTLRIIDWMIRDQKIVVSFEAEKGDGLTCLLMCNETAAHMEGPWEPGFFLNKDIQDHSFGVLYYCQKPGNSDPCDFSWDEGEIYDQPTYETNFKKQPMSVRICEVNGFPAGYHVGFTFVVTALDPYYLSVGGKDDESLRVINIQIVASSDP